MTQLICLQKPQENRNYYVFGYYGSSLDNIDENGKCRFGHAEMDEAVKAAYGNIGGYASSGFVIDHSALENVLMDPNYEPGDGAFQPHLRDIGELLAVGIYPETVAERSIRLYGVSKIVSDVENYLLDSYPAIVTAMSDGAQRALAVLVVGDGYDMISSLSGTVVYLDSLGEFIDSENYNPTPSDVMLANNVYRTHFDKKLQPDLAAAVSRAFEKYLLPLWWAGGM